MSTVDSRSPPSDVPVVLLAVGLVDAAALTVPAGPVRVLAALAALAFLPGYALTTVLFPARASAAAESVGGFRRRVPDRPAVTDGERLALSFGLSVALVPLYGIAIVLLTGSSWFPPTTVLAATTIVTVVALAVGTVRRLRTPAEERYGSPLGRLVGWLRVGLRGPRLDVALNVALALAVVVALGAFAFSVTTPVDGSTYTDVSLLTRGPGGEPVAAGYERNFTVGERATYLLAVDNREQRPIDYTVVVQLQRVQPDGEVSERTRLLQFGQRVAANGTWLATHELAPRTVGTRLRVAYLVYRGDAPADPRIDDAYRHLTLWIDVRPASAGAADSGDPPGESTDAPDVTAGALAPARPSIRGAPQGDGVVAVG